MILFVSDAAMPAFVAGVNAAQRRSGGGICQKRFRSVPASVAGTSPAMRGGLAPEERQ
jgi:hypothetical protein